MDPSGWDSAQGHPNSRELRSRADRGEPGPGEWPSASFHLQCAVYKLCHPEELVLLGHSLGIPQAPLSHCSSQALQLVSVWRGRMRRDYTLGFGLLKGAGVPLPSA